MNKTLPISIAILVISLLIFAPVNAKTTETKVTVMALSKGAKFIGSSMGGARVTIKNHESGEVLASGKTKGSTGNTEKIMRQKHGRNRVLSTDDSAKFTTSLWLEEPTTVKIKAHGPLDHPDDANTASVTQKIIPGKDLTGGDAVRLQIRGFIVDILSPKESWFEADTKELTVEAQVSMMCGCPITPGGLWDANDYQIRMSIYEGNKMIDDFPLRYSGEPSHFERTVTLERTGCYDIQVYAYDPSNGNTGYEEKTCTLSR